MTAAVWTLIALYAALAGLMFRGQQELRREIGDLRAEMIREFGQVKERLVAIETRLQDHDARLSALEANRR